MQTKNAIAGAIILTSALVGTVVGLLELSDRAFTEQTVAIAGNGPTLITPTPTPEPVQPDPPETAPASQSPVAALSPLQQDIQARVTEGLATYACQDVQVAVIEAGLTVTPAAESTSGFDGYYLDGEAVLRAAEHTQRIRLAGTGKGPNGEGAAVAMALRGFEAQLKDTDMFQDFCEGN
jgi:hypothetical protein